MIEIIHTDGSQTLVHNATGFKFNDYLSMFLVYTSGGNEVHFPAHSVMAIGKVIATPEGYVYE